jgi:hypothetical protein
MLRGRLCSHGRWRVRGSRGDGFWAEGDMDGLITSGYEARNFCNRTGIWLYIVYRMPSGSFEPRRSVHISMERVLSSQTHFPHSGDHITKDKSRNMSTEGSASRDRPDCWDHLASGSTERVGVALSREYSIISCWWGRSPWSAFWSKSCRCFTQSWRDIPLAVDVFSVAQRLGME